MSCPDWRHLAAHRYRAGGEEPEGWAEALAHLEVCARCRGAALATDPTLLFRRLPPASASRSDVETMRRAVATLRRSGRVAPPRRGLTWRRRATLAAALVVTALGVLPGGAGRWAPAEPAAGDVARAGSPHPSGPPADTAWRGELPAAQPIDGLNLPDARVYQLAGDNLPVVMIVDASLDV